MRWKIKGAVRATGADISTTIEADTHESAISDANLRGIMVSEAISLDDEIAAYVKIERERADTTPPQSNTPSSPTLSQPSAINLPMKGIPDYMGLLVASTFIRVFAIVFYLGGALALVIGVAILINPSQGTKNIDAAVLIVQGLGALVSAAFAHGLSELCKAVRDIAQNSFRSK